MGQYVAFLRGINVGSAKKVPMAELRALAEELGYTDVKTYINSGNLIFRATKRATTLESEITAGLRDRFGLQVDVAVRSPHQLRELLAANPYPDGDPSQVTLAFLTAAPPPGAEAKVAAVATEAEPFTFTGHDVWVHYSNGIADSKLAARFSAVVGVSATVRNVRTVQKVLDLLDT